MAKRGADKQLTDQNWERDGSDDEGSQSESGSFKAAAPEAIAGRRIRGLPQRKGAAAAPAPPVASVPAASSAFGAFGGFGGFGSSTSSASAPSANPFASAPSSATSTSTNDEPVRANPFASTTFSFGATAPKAEAPKPAATSFSFGVTPASSTPTSALTGPAALSAPSFGSSSSSPNFAFGGSSSSISKPVKEDTSPALTYYLGLRGLNISFLDALAKEMEKNPFINLTGSGFDTMKQKYENRRGKIEAEFAKAAGTAENGVAEEKSSTPTSAAAPFSSMPTSTTSSSSSPTQSSNAAPSFPSFVSPVPTKATEGTVKAPAGPAPPGPPAIFSWGGNVVKLSSNPASPPSEPVSGGFVFKPDAPKDPHAEKSGFSFPAGAAPPVPSSSSSSSSSNPASKLAPTKSIKDAEAAKRAASKLSNAPAAPSPLRFGESVSPPPQAPKALPSAEEKKLNEFEKSQEPPKDYSKVPPPPAFSFGSTFGSLAKGGEESRPAAKLNPAAATFSFGASSPNPTSAAVESPKEAAPAAAAASTTTTTSAPAAPSNPFAFNTPIKFGSSAPISKPTASPPLSTTFGSGSPPSFGFGAGLNRLPTPTSSTASAGFTFGISPSFGAKTPSTSSPDSKSVPSFSFGPAATSTAPAAVSPTFSFGAASAAPSTAPSSNASTPAAESSTNGEETPNTADDIETRDIVAEGEEDETILIEKRGRAFELNEGKNVGLGIVIIWVKEREIDGKMVRRILARNDVNKSVVLNFRLYSGFTVRLEKTFLTFNGFDGGERKTFRLRFKEVKDAQEFKTKVEEAAKDLA